MSDILSAKRICVQHPIPPEQPQSSPVQGESSTFELSKTTSSLPTWLQRSHSDHTKPEKNSGNKPGAWLLRVANRRKIFGACLKCPRVKNLIMYRLAHEKKNYGFTPNLDFNPLFTKFNLNRISAYKHAFREYAAHKGRKEQAKHGICIALKLVVLNIREGMHFWQLCREKQTNISEQPHSLSNKVISMEAI